MAHGLEGWAVRLAGCCVVGFWLCAIPGGGMGMCDVGVRVYDTCAKMVF